MKHERLKTFSIWLRRKSRLPLIAVGALIIMLLAFNEDTSLTLNMQYEKQAAALKREIKECKDSAAFFRARRLALERGTDDLEHMAREQYHMQKPSEDVFILK